MTQLDILIKAQDAARKSPLDGKSAKDLVDEAFAESGLPAPCKELFRRAFDNALGHYRLASGLPAPEGKDGK